MNEITWFSVPGFFSLNLMISGSIHAATNDRVSFSFGLNSIPLCVGTMFSLSFHQLVDTWFASVFCLLWVVWQWTQEFRCLLAMVISFLFSVFPVGGLLGHVMVLNLGGNIHTLFGYNNFYFSQWCATISFLHLYKPCYC